MIRINQIKLDIQHSEDDLKNKILKLLHIKNEELLSYTIRKQSIDARKKPVIYYVYSVDVKLRNESGFLKRRQHLKSPNIEFLKSTTHLSRESMPDPGQEPLAHRPIVIGTGPAGLFCGYQLALQGYRPILLERGAPLEERMHDVEKFWAEGILNPNSNVQFGEGGAGTFSDGKLNTLVRDTSGRITRVLEIFVEQGAPKEILYQNKPHIGTDILAKVVKNMRDFIISHGGEVRFHSQVTGLIVSDAGECNIVPCTDNAEKDLHLKALRVRNPVTGKEEILETELTVLAIGHSARDTFSMLYASGIPMESKAFAVGVRVEHPQEMINENQYGPEYPEELPAASYKLTASLPSGRGVYTFCMCPGGYVVNASSEPGRTAINGMSYHDRKGCNANSAVVVTVTPEDFGCEDVLAGMEFQRCLEEKACLEGKGRIPVQLYEDFCKNRPSSGPGDIEPQIKGTYTWSNVRSIFPEELAVSLEEGIQIFDSKIHGYARPDAVISGVESRTSSPVRILRDETSQSSLRGLYPCGEGAGYAGGITSAAMDGLKIAEVIVKKYRSFDT